MRIIRLSYGMPIMLRKRSPRKLALVHHIRIPLISSSKSKDRIVVISTWLIALKKRLLVSSSSLLMVTPITVWALLPILKRLLAWALAQMESPCLLLVAMIFVSTNGPLISQSWIKMQSFKHSKMYSLIFWRVVDKVKCTET